MLDPAQCWGAVGGGGVGRALPQDWGEHVGGGGVVPISDFIRLAGM